MDFDGFKTVRFGGFDKETVLEYIELQKRHEADALASMQKKYKELENTVKILRSENEGLLAALSAKSSDDSGDADEIRKELAEVTGELDTTRAECERLKKEYAGLQALYEAVEKSSTNTKEYNELNDKVNELTDRNNILEQTNADYLSEMKALGEKNRALAAELEALKAKGVEDAEAIKRENEELKARVAAAEAKADAAADEWKDRLAAADSAAAELKAENDSLRSKTESFGSAEEEYRNNERELKDALDAAETRLEQTEKELDVLRADSERVRSAETQLGAAMINAQVYSDGIITGAKSEATEIRSATLGQLGTVFANLVSSNKALNDFNETFTIMFAEIMNAMKELTDSVRESSETITETLTEDEDK